MSATTIDRPRPALWLTIGLWAVQIGLALLFVMAGGNKLLTPWADLVAMMPAGATMPEALVRFIGLAEVAGAIGLVLPAATRVAPVLTAWAAVGLATIMVLATGFHASRGESVAITVALLAASSFVAWGRFRAAPFAPR